MITLTHRHIGTVTLDAVIEETHQAELRITENPVESGAMIGDHAVLMPQTVTIAGIVVDYQPQRSPAPAAEEHRAEPLSVLTDRVPFPTDLLPFTTQALRVAQRELPSVISQATAPQSDGQHAVRPLADWLPDFQPITPVMILPPQAALPRCTPPYGIYNAADRPWRYKPASRSIKTC
ncbi:phage baseplate protein [Xylella fastidiosa subsp. multiplex]|uniref:phage baseplate protein n=1 Tax=Xylella fastidiosa TaxID=2371 RepID=UPI003729EE7A